MDEKKTKPSFFHKWLWIFAGFIVVLLAVLFFIYSMKMVKNPDPSELSFDLILKNPQVQQLIGTPIKRTYSKQGQLKMLNAGKGFAALKYEISGPKGNAHVLVWAIQNEGKWQIAKLIVLSSNNKNLQIINLSPNEPVNDFLKLFSPNQ